MFCVNQKLFLKKFIWQYLKQLRKLKKYQYGHFKHNIYQWHYWYAMCSTTHATAHAEFILVSRVYIQSTAQLNVQDQLVSAEAFQAKHYSRNWLTRTQWAFVGILLDTV